MSEPIRPRYSLYHMAKGDTFAEEIRAKLAARHPEACFLCVDVPTGTLVGSVEDLRALYPHLADQLDDKSSQD